MRKFLLAAMVVCGVIAAPTVSIADSTPLPLVMAQYDMYPHPGYLGPPLRQEPRRFYRPRYVEPRRFYHPGYLGPPLRQEPRRFYRPRYVEPRPFYGPRYVEPRRPTYEQPTFNQRGIPGYLDPPLR